jgi:hypothetical protein
MKRRSFVSLALLPGLVAGVALAARAAEKAAPTTTTSTTTTSTLAAAPAAVSPLATFVGRWAGYEEIKYVNGCSGGDRIVIDIHETTPGKYTGVLTYRNSSCRVYGKNAPEQLTLSWKAGRLIMVTPAQVTYEGSLANGMLTGELSGAIIRRGTWNAQGPQ